jgi:hypothetical protein
VRFPVGHADTLTDAGAVIGGCSRRRGIGSLPGISEGDEERNIR